MGQDGDESVLSRQYGGEESGFPAEGGGGGEEVFVIWGVEVGRWMGMCIGRRWSVKEFVGGVGFVRFISRGVFRVEVVIPRWPTYHVYKLLYGGMTYQFHGRERRRSILQS